MGGEGTIEFVELGFNDLGDCRDFKAIVGSVIGNIPRSVKDSAKAGLVELLFYRIINPPSPVFSY